MSHIFKQKVLIRDASQFFRSFYQGSELPCLRPFVGLRLKNHAQGEMICDCCGGDGGDPQDDCSACVVRQEYK